MSGSLAIIGGTGLTELPGLTISKAHDVSTPFGNPSAPVLEGVFKGVRLLFIARHGHPHRIPPHMVNYRANMWALQNLYATDVLAVNAVGGISPNMKPGTLVMPAQVIDYTYGREHTVFDGSFAPMSHIDFTHPYSSELRERVAKSASKLNEKVINGGVYGATQGPRLETAAEIFRLENDGCDIVGMTGMPEASLARELKLNYVSLSLVVNLAAGKSNEAITIKLMEEQLDSGMHRVKSLIGQLVEDFYS